MLFIEKIKNKFSVIDQLFWWSVAAPTLFATLYFGLIASDVYVSESSFVIRVPERQSASTLGMILKGAGFSSSDNDAYAVQSYILSRDAVQSLDQTLGIKNSYASKNIDPFSRFSTFSWDDSFENFHRYYQKRIDFQLDSQSSIATLIVRAYTAQDSYNINLMLLEQAEGLVNKLNERGRQDMIRYAADEVGDLQQKAKLAALALARYRNEKGVIDPEKQSTIPLQQIAKLQDELIATKITILQIKKVSKDNPQLPVLFSREQLLLQEIQTVSQSVAGGDRSLAIKASEFQRLALEKDFSDKLLASAMVTLEQARNAAQRQQLYLEQIAQPSLPDAAMEPYRLRNICATILIGFIVWGVMSLMLAAVKEHLD